MIYVNDIPLNVTIFPDNTSQVWKLPEELLNTKFVDVEWNFTSEGEFLHLAQLKMLLNSRGVRVDLHLSYLPYARQDKPVRNNTTFALCTFAKLLNSLEFDHVYCLDPHSKVAGDLINHFVDYYALNELGKTFDVTSTDVVCYPDTGAINKYTNKYTFPFPYIYGDKVRDQLTGNITNYTVHGNVKDKNILIVDDICDGGMTFKLLAKQLLDNGAKEVNLFITHGIFSKGLQTLKDSGIKNVFTKDGEVNSINDELTYRRL